VKGEGAGKTQQQQTSLAMHHCPRHFSGLDIRDIPMCGNGVRGGYPSDLLVMLKYLGFGNRSHLDELQKS
jgi:hypothetical protein